MTRHPMRYHNQPMSELIGVQISKLQEVLPLGWQVDVMLTPHGVGLRCIDPDGKDYLSGLDFQISDDWLEVANLLVFLRTELPGKAIQAGAIKS